MDMSGGEHKRKEALQLCVLQPKFSIVDELASGLDVDALRMVSRRIEEATENAALGVVAITHLQQAVRATLPRRCACLRRGPYPRVRRSELADVLKAEGYERWSDAQPDPEPAANPFRDPFADLLI